MLPQTTANLATAGGIDSRRHLLHVSWTDSHIAAKDLTRENILEYFCNHSNPFYERTCNNEELRMQRIPWDRLTSMQGTQYSLFHADEPLFVIRKQHRSSPNQVMPLSDYYIIAGVVYQAPDICSVINSRVLASLISLREAFQESLGYSTYHASKGYSWNFPDSKTKKKSPKETEEKSSEKASKNEASTTLFQRTRADTLLGLLAEQFPLEQEQESADVKPKIEETTTKSETGSQDLKRPLAADGELGRPIKIPKTEPGF